MESPRAVTSRSRAAAQGLPSLRLGGRTTEVLFLYEVATHSYSRLRFIAERVGISVQAASLLYRKLSGAGFVSLSDGTYRLTVRGIAHLHSSLESLGQDIQGRLEHLQVVRTTRAVADGALRKGDAVDLVMEDGVLRARPGGNGPSTGRAVSGGPEGELVEVGELRGILPLTSAPIVCVSVPLGALGAAAVRTQIRREAADKRHGLVSAYGLEAQHLLSKVHPGPLLRFGVPAALREASQVGVSALVVVTDDKLADLLQRLGENRPAPKVVVRELEIKP